MEENFKDIYNQVNSTILQNKLDITTLKLIHKLLFKDLKYSGEFRNYIRDDCEYIIEEQINLVKNALDESFTQEEFMLVLIRCISIIYLYQPFMDGNHRVCLLLAKILMELKGFKMRKIEESYFDIEIIPILYSKDDEISENMMIPIKKLIDNN